MILWMFWYGMVEAEECLFGVAGHGEVDLSLCVVQIKVNAQVMFAVLIMRDGVKFTQDAYELFGVLFADKCNAGLINAESEGDVAIFLRPES